MKKILVVEDEYIIAINIKNYLTKLGYTVTTEITDPRAIIDSVRQYPYDLILMNVKLQGELDGIEIVNEIRSFSSIPVIYLTSATDKVTRSRAEKTKHEGFVFKPFEYEELREAVEQCGNPAPGK